ncbi:MAG TPA: aminotransferase class III-fold pyridoxal phosphate-dependent enzyme [Bacteriovoracaceae bacterium]|nr:aminotransferase class III-fold pyridoxal phosphate-dependent enzyme [Bacteriovoracaceae bacterium]
MAKTVGDGFFNDSRLQQAKKLIQEALKEHTSLIKGVKPADPALKDSYDALLKKMADFRGGALFYNYLGTGIGHGPLVELADGSVKYDFITGIGVHYMGHSHPGVIEAQLNGALSNTVMNGHLQQNIDTTKLLELMSTQACKNGAEVKNVFLSTSGAMANENGFKMILQKHSPAGRFFAFEKCFAGRTLGMAWVTDKAAYRQGLPKTLDVDYIPFYSADDHKGSIEKAVYTMKKKIARFQGQHAGFIMELIQGENGSWVGHTEYFEALIQVCKDNNISVMIDEVQTFARTHELFAFQFFKLDKLIDVVSIGKNSQVCATLFKDDHKPKPGLMSQTFTGASSQIAASYYIINEIVNGSYLGEKGKIEKLHQHFKGNLEKIAKKYPEKLEGPYGIGAMVAMTVFKGDEPKSKAFTIKLFENGVMSFMASGHPTTRVRFLMPIMVTDNHHIDEVCAIIDKTLKEME